MRQALALMALAGGLAGCAVTGDDDGLLVFAAASLAGALPPLVEGFEAERGVEVEVVFAGSSSLRAQLVDGAPADVFIAADEATMAAAVDGGAIDGSPTLVARNRVALVVPTGNPGAVASVADLARGELLVGLCAPSVPCGAVARAALDGAGVEAAADTEEPDVRSLLAKVVAGELDAAVVYLTDVIGAAGAVEELPFETGPEGVTAYPAARVRDGDTEGAAAFIEFLVTDPAQSTLAGFGFEAP